MQAPGRTGHGVVRLPRFGGSRLPRPADASVVWDSKLSPGAAVTWDRLETHLNAGIERTFLRIPVPSSLFSSAAGSSARAARTL